MLPKRTARCGSLNTRRNSIRALAPRRRIGNHAEAGEYGPGEWEAEALRGLVILTGRVAEILHFRRRRFLVETPSAPGTIRIGLKTCCRWMQTTPGSAGMTPPKHSGIWWRRSYTRWLSGRYGGITGTPPRCKSANRVETTFPGLRMAPLF